VFDQLVARPSGARDADDWKVELSPAREHLQRGKDLLEREVSRRTEEDERIRSRSAVWHRRQRNGRRSYPR